MPTDWAAYGLWGYLGVALAAATPWVEVLVVVPPAIAFGLHPVAVTSAAFVGNYLPVVGIAVAYEPLRRRARKRWAPSGEGRRHRRGRRLLARYGVPGLALIGPLVTGLHLATLLAMATGASRKSVLAWTAASLAVWTGTLAVLSAFGLYAVRGS